MEINDVYFEILKPYGINVLGLFDIGVKSIEVEENGKTFKENALIKQISRQITQRIKDKEIRFTPDYLDFTGDLSFNDED